MLKVVRCSDIQRETQKMQTRYLLGILNRSKEKDMQEEKIELETEMQTNEIDGKGCHEQKKASILQQTKIPPMLEEDNGITRVADTSTSNTPEKSNVVIFSTYSTMGGYAKAKTPKCPTSISNIPDYDTANSPEK
ncbi:hypothetical protein C0J52_13771 [Blattella germanica]|nr:hypothetical protein C0J52_13771 [Blattella germanica]